MSYGSPTGNQGYPESSGRSHGHYPLKVMDCSTKIWIIIGAIIEMIFVGIVCFFVFRFLFGPIVLFLAPFAALLGFEMGLLEGSRGYKKEPLLEKLAAAAFGLVAGVLVTFFSLLLIGYLYKDSPVSGVLLLSIFLITAAVVTILMYYFSEE